MTSTFAGPSYFYNSDDIFKYRDENMCDKWKKDEKHENMDKTIDKISKKQFSRLKEWEKMHPDFLTNEKLTKIYLELCKMAGVEVDDPAVNKTIKKQISNSVKLNKEDMNEII